MLKLLSPAVLGEIELANRMILAPLTRCRAGTGFVPQPINALYYAQRASAGLIITEATQVARNGIGYPNTPGIYSPEQVEGWKQVTKAVHKKKGKIFLQLWHAGRVAHPTFLEPGEIPIAPNPKIRSRHFVYQGYKGLYRLSNLCLIWLTNIKLREKLILFHSLNKHDFKY